MHKEESCLRSRRKGMGGVSGGLKGTEREITSWGERWCEIKHHILPQPTLKGHKSRSDYALKRFSSQNWVLEWINFEKKSYSVLFLTKELNRQKEENLSVTLSQKGFHLVFERLQIILIWHLANLFNFCRTCWLKKMLAEIRTEPGAL